MAVGTRARDSIQQSQRRASPAYCSTILALYDPKASIKVSADASSFGLGAVLLQESEAGWRPVAYASRSMNETEQRYAQIEKEALGIT